MIHPDLYRSEGIIELELQNPTWIIDRFAIYATILEPSHPLISNSFSDGIHDDVQWFLSLYPRGDTESFEEYLSLFIMNVSDYDIEANVTFSLIDAKKQVHRRTSITRAVYPRCEWVGIHKFQHRAQVLDLRNSLIWDGLLRINCSIIRSRIYHKAEATWQYGDLTIERLPENDYY